MNSPTDKKRHTIYLDPKISELFEKAAADEDRSFTKQVERIIKDWLVQKNYLKTKK